MCPDSPEAQEMLRRFEKDIDIIEAKSKDDLVRKFKYWQNRNISLKQEVAVRQFAEEKGITAKEKWREKAEAKPRVTKPTRIKGERIRVRYIPIKRYTKKGIRYTVQKRSSKTGRYVK